MSVLLFLAVNFAYASNDRALLRSLFDSVQNSEAEGRKGLLRQIALYPFSKDDLREVALPRLGEILLNDPQESVRREAAKALFAVVKDADAKRAFRVLLESGRIDVENTLDTMVVASLAEHYLPVVKFISSYGVSKSRRRDATVAALDLWPKETCDESLTYFEKPFAGDIDTNPAFDLLKGKEVKTQLPSAKSFLRAIAFTPSAMEKDLVESAQLILGCLGDGQAIRAVVKSFFFADIEKKIRLATFFGEWQALSTLAALGDCARREERSPVRVSCLTALSNFNLDVAKAQLNRTFDKVDLRERRLLIELLRLKWPANELQPVFSVWAKREKNESLRDLLKATD